MDTSAPYDPTDRFTLTDAGAEYLARRDGAEDTDDGAEDPAAGGAYAGPAYAAAPLDEQVDDADVIPFP